MVVCIECVDLDAEFEFFRDRIGLLVDIVSPADDPRRVSLHAGDGRIELRRSDPDRPVSIRLATEDPDLVGEYTSPGGSSVSVVVDAEPTASGASMAVPDSVPSLWVDDGDSDVGVGRAGMEYQDLLPDRWGGRFVASRIRITDGGDVDDWVHFHRIRFQMIYVASGWVEVVYEGQGAAFRMEAGDCVLQPPEIRHRVLRSSPGLEVIEVGCPAEHDTVADHSLDLPTPIDDVTQDFSGQRFVRHVAADATPVDWLGGALRRRRTGLHEATGALADVFVVEPVSGPAEPVEMTHDGEFVLLVGLAGAPVVHVADRRVELRASASIAIPPGTSWHWTNAGAHDRTLVVEMPGGAIVDASEFPSGFGHSAAVV